MTFCSNCGNQVEEGGFCGNCGTAASSSAQPPQQPMAPPPMAPPPPQYQQPPPQPQYQQQQPPPQYQQPPPQYQQQYAPYPPAPPNPIVADGINTVKSFFSPDPTAAVRVAVASKAHSWAGVAGASILLMALAVTLLPGGIMAYFANAAMRGMGMLGGLMPRTTVGEVNSSLPLGSYFGFGLLASAIMYFAWACCVKVIYSISKVNASFMMVLNMAAVSLLPLAATWTVAILAGFIWAPLAFLLLAVGIVSNVVLLYHGTITSVSLQRNPFWLFVGAIAACAIILYLLVSQFFGELIQMLVGSLFTSALGNLLDGFGSGFGLW